MTKSDSELIKLSRFPLAVMVVFLHAEPIVIGWDMTNMTTEHMGANIAGVTMLSISHILTQIAVPIFFVISGFLFFQKLQEWDTREWKRKMQSRAKTLLIPYLVWVFLFCLISAVKFTVTNYGISGIRTGVAEWLSEQGGLLSAFWSSVKWISGASNLLGQKIIMSGPVPFHLWFIRDLIVAVLFTPAFYLFLRRKHCGISVIAIISMVVLALLYIAQINTGVPGLSFSTLFFFGLGAFMSLNNIQFSVCYKYRYILYALSLLLFIVLIPLDGSRTILGSKLFPCWVLCGSITFLNIEQLYLKSNIFKSNIFNGIEKSAFFLYVVHPFFLSLVWTCVTKAICLIYSTDSITDLAFVEAHPVVYILAYFFKVFGAIVISVVIYKIMARFFPKTTQFLCGR